MLTTTGCIPVGIPAGIWKLIWVTPTSPGEMPAKTMVAGAPATVTVTGVFCGDGNEAKGVVDAGVEPVATAGVTPPAPVKYSAVVCPRAALPIECATGSPKIPGDADAMAKVWDVTT
jgi:hypothetical protein